VYVNGKMRPVETIPGMGEGDKGEWWGWIQTWSIINTFLNFTMYPQYNNKKITK
jgi:hypothetical protein